MNFNKNQKQFTFNEIRGIVTEMNPGDQFCSITIECGHENKRNVNFVAKKEMYDEFAKCLKIGEKISVKYYAVSRFKNMRWYTTLNLLDIEWLADEQKTNSDTHK